MIKNETKKITLTAQSVVTVVDGDSTKEIAVKGFTASIDSTNPENMTISDFYHSAEGKALYKEHRSECRVDEASFEDAAYALQDQMIAELKTE